MATIRELPIFQLGLVLYPAERLPLHIFEERYKEMVAYCLDHKAPFGVLLYDDGKLATVGCTARVVRVINQYEDGRMDIIVEGHERFQVASLFNEKSYLTAEVETIPEASGDVERPLRERLITQHIKLVELAERTLQPTVYQDVEHLAYFIAHNAGLSLEQKQQVLEMPTESERVSFLVQHLEKFIPKVKAQEEIRRRVRSNGDLRDFPPLSK